MVCTGVGLLLAEMALDKPLSFNVSPFRLSRFQ